MSEQKSSMDRCEHCGTTSIRFDPPIALQAVDGCGVQKPGTYGSPPGGIPVCDLPKGHDGQHGYIVEYMDRWSDPAPLFMDCKCSPISDAPAL